MNKKLGLNDKDIFVVNCYSCNNIPFYQKIFSKFNIKYSVICNTDHFMDGDPEGTNRNGWNGDVHCPTFASHIQHSIQQQYDADHAVSKANYFLVTPMTFEPCHASLADPYKYSSLGDEGKPFKADRYWKQLASHSEQSEFIKVPIISYIRKIISQPQ